MAGKDEKIVHVTNESFSSEVLESSTPVLVDFWATWCGPCRSIAPLLGQLATEFDGKVKIAKVDVDAAQDVAMKYSIRSIPTLLMFKGGKVVDQVVGAVPKNKLVNMIEKSLA